jgi:hypothetical protein
MSRGVGSGLAGGRAVLALVACLTGGLLAAGTAQAYEPTGSDFRISNVFTDGEADRVGTDSAVAYNPIANEYLVVFRADPATDNEFEIYGRRVSAAGAPLGTDFRISNVGTDGDAARDADAPAVAYNQGTNEYMVVWSGDPLPADEEHEIYFQRVSAAGAPDAQGDVRVSNVDPGGPDRDAERPSVAANPETSQYLVTWQADDDEVDDKLEIYSRLISGAGVPVVSGDERISNGAPDSEQTFDSLAPDVAYNPASNEYLIVWQGEAFVDHPGLAEIFAQRVNTAGEPDDVQGDLRVSDLGADTATDRDGLVPAVAYNPINNAYLVVWRDDGYEGAADNEYEIFGQRISAIGDEQANDFRVSAVGTDGDAARLAGPPDVSFSTSGSEYLVVWHGNPLAMSGELEVYGQRLDANGGQLDGDQRISTAGAENDPMIDAEDPSVTFGSGSNSFLAAWTADDLGTNEEFEIFGRFLAPAPVVATPPPPQRAYELPKKKCKKKKKKKKKGKSAAAAKKKKKKKKKC